jgi:dolichol-phosphate mannosyltransferase
MSMSRTIFFVIPAYNEAANIPTLLEDLAPRARALSARVIVVDDGSTDDTAGAVRVCVPDMDLRILGHRANCGLGAAINTGLRAALEEASDEDAIVTLEADTTSDLDDLPAMLEELDRGRDLVLASVYAPGGAIRGVSKPRVALSKGVSNCFRVACGLHDLHTLSSLYRVYRAGALRRAAETHGSLLVREPGFAANIELLLKLHADGARIGEVPTVNDWSTRQGTSKMRLAPTARAYIRVLAAHFMARAQPKPVAQLAEVGSET